MSDDLVKRLRADPNWMREDYPQSEAAYALEAQAAEITRLRAWRDAINGYLTEAWNSPLRDDEAPLAALKRLIKLELTAMALDPEIHKAMNAALATARRDALAEIKQDTDELIEQGRQDGMEEAAKIADGRPSDCGEDIAAAIRAAARVEKPSDDRPSEEIIREDRDAWPDHQANDPIRAASGEGK